MICRTATLLEVVVCKIGIYWNREIITLSIIYVYRNLLKTQTSFDYKEIYVIDKFIRLKEKNTSMSYK